MTAALSVRFLLIPMKWLTVTLCLICTRELLSSSEITPIYVKSKYRNNFPAFLVEHLFDVPSRLKSNVKGSGKEHLDLEIMQYTKAKIFEFYECLASEVKKEWKNVSNQY